MDDKEAVNGDIVDGDVDADDVDDDEDAEFCEEVVPISTLAKSISPLL